MERKKHKISCARLHPLPAQATSPHPSDKNRKGKLSKAPREPASPARVSGSQWVWERKTGGLHPPPRSRVLGLHNLDLVALRGAGREVGSPLSGPFPGLEPSTGAGQPCRAYLALYRGPFRWPHQDMTQSFPQCSHNLGKRNFWKGFPMSKTPYSAQRGRKGSPSPTCPVSGSSGRHLPARTGGLGKAG